MKSVKEKAEAYDEALGRLEDIKTGKCQKTFVFTEGLFDYLFPELRESEDERMKNGLISHLKELKERAAEGSFLKHPTHYDAWLAWLEKQGEQNLANSAKTCKDEQKPILDVEIPFGAKDSELQEASYSIPNGYHAEIEGNNVIIKKGEHKPWSEEDEDILNTIINHFKVDIGCTDEDDMVRWLKSLRPQTTWKPTEQQMKVLNEVINFAADHGTMRWNDYIYNVLKGLREQLKKL